MDKKKTGNLIREARTKKKYTQRELGDLLGVSNKAVSRWENGEAFPDVEILENLAMILEVSIQDIVTGNTKVNDAGVEDEIVRIARLQHKEAKRRAIRNSLWLAEILCCFISGCLALGGEKIYIADGSIPGYIRFYSVIMCLSFAFTLAACALQNETDKKEPDKFDKGGKIVAVISVLWSILLIWGVLIMASNGHIPFGMELSSVGPFVLWQLIGLFALNLVMNVWEIYRYERCGMAIHWGFFLSIAAMYLIVLYGDNLYSMDTLEGLLKNLATRTGVVVIVTGIFLMAAKRLKNHSQA